LTWPAMLIGEVYWRSEPPDQATVEGCGATSKDAWLPLPELIESFGEVGCDVVEMVLADQDSWDRCEAAQWLNIRRWLDANPHDELADQMPNSPPHLRAMPGISASTWAGGFRIDEPLSQMTRLKGGTEAARAGRADTKIASPTRFAYRADQAPRAEVS
jgi:hypothetical protein